MDWTSIRVAIVKVNIFEMGGTTIGVPALVCDIRQILVVLSNGGNHENYACSCDIFCLFNCSFGGNRDSVTLRNGDHLSGTIVNSDVILSTGLNVSFNH
jgi:hypothetical protein